MTLSGNRVGPDVNLTKIAESLEGYTGSDIKEVCREAVVRVAHERAMQLEKGFTSTNASPASDAASADSERPGNFSFFWILFLSVWFQNFV